jgi:hypothetical protein
MKSIKKRILSILLAASMTVAAIPLSAGAAESPESTQAESTQAESRYRSTKIAEPQFTRIHRFSDGMARAESDSGKATFIDTDGNIIIVEPEYDHLRNFFVEGFAIFRSYVGGDVSYSSSYRWGFLGKDGKVAIEPIFAEVWDFKDGLAKVSVITNEDPWTTKQGFIDTTGKYVVQPQFDIVADSFSEGFVMVQNQPHGRWGPTVYGFVDSTGKTVVPVENQSATEFSNGMASYATQDGTIHYIDTSLKTVVSITSSDGFSGIDGNFSNGYAWVRSAERTWLQCSNGWCSYNGADFETTCWTCIAPRLWGVINTNKRMVVPFTYTYVDRITHRADGLMRAYLNTGENFSPSFYDEGLHNFVLVDYKGEVHTPVVRETAHFSEGLAAVNIGGRGGFINEDGDVVIEPQFNYVWSFRDGVARVAMGYQWDRLFGFIDTTGKIIIPIELRSANDFSEGLSATYDSEKQLVGYMDKTGKVVIDHRYTNGQPFSGGIAIVNHGSYDPYSSRADRGTVFGAINAAGEEVIPLEFDYAFSVAPGLVQVRKGELHGIMNAEGEYVMPLEYTHIAYRNLQNDISHDELASVEKDGKIGFINRNFQKVIPLEYDEVRAFIPGDEMTAVRQGDKWGLIGTRGEIIIPLEYDSISTTVARDNHSPNIQVPEEIDGVRFIRVQQDGLWGMYTVIIDDCEECGDCRYCACECGECEECVIPCEDCGCCEVCGFCGCCEDCGFCEKCEGCLCGCGCCEDCGDCGDLDECEECFLKAQPLYEVRLTRGGPGKLPATFCMCRVVTGNWVEIFISGEIDKDEDLRIPAEELTTLDLSKSVLWTLAGYDTLGADYAFYGYTANDDGSITIHRAGIYIYRTLYLIDGELVPCEGCDGCDEHGVVIPHKCDCCEICGLCGECAVCVCTHRFPARRECGVTPCRDCGGVVYECGEDSCGLCNQLVSCDCGCCGECGLCGLCSECVVCECGCCADCGLCGECEVCVCTHRFPTRRECGVTPCRDCGGVVFECGECDVCIPPEACTHRFPTMRRCGMTSCRDCDVIWVCGDDDCERCNPTEPTEPPVESCECRNCDDCGFSGGEYGFGRVRGDDGGEEPGIDDAVEILKFIVGLDNVIAGNDNAIIAAKITSAGNDSLPGIDDAVEVLKFIVGLDNVLDEHYGK